MPEILIRRMRDWRLTWGLIGVLPYLALTIILFQWLSVGSRCIHGDCEDGAGILEYKNGVVYAGDFRDGQRHGQGSFTAPGGHRYAGQWRDDRKHGFGRYTYPNEAVYSGEFRDGRRHGPGKLVYAGGTSYEGRWEDGRPDGPIITTLADGRRLSGVYDDGRIVDGAGVQLDTDGKTLHIGRWRDGEAEAGGVTMQLDALAPAVSIKTQIAGEAQDFDDIPPDHISGKF